MNATAPRVVQFDWEAFAAFVDAKRREHDARPEADAIAASMAAFTRWGVAPPRSFTNQHRDALAALRTGKATPAARGLTP